MGGHGQEATCLPTTWS